MSNSCRLEYINEWKLNQVKHIPREKPYGNNARLKLFEVIEVKVKLGTDTVRFTPAKSSLRAPPSPAAFRGPSRPFGRLRRCTWVPALGLSRAGIEGVDPRSTALCT